VLFPQGLITPQRLQALGQWGVGLGQQLRGRISGLRRP